MIRETPELCAIAFVCTIAGGSIPPKRISKGVGS